MGRERDRPDYSREGCHSDIGLDQTPHYMKILCSKGLTDPCFSGFNTVHGTDQDQ